VIRRGGASLDDLEALYRSRFDVFARVAAGVTGDTERARDAVQEGFATAVRRRGSYRGEGPLEAWVWRIVLNTARSDVRRGAPVADREVLAATGKHRNLTRNEGPDTNPVWSPDGKRIAFISGRDGSLQLYVMNADGSKQRNLTRDEIPTSCPSGRRTGNGSPLCRGVTATGRCTS
jgi:hypothetical protein